MSFSRQDKSITTGRVNQKARTRAALIQAAIDLMRDGRPPSMPEAAERALISLATSYRYFASAEDLWWEASTSAAGRTAVVQANVAIDEAGDEPQARLEAYMRVLGFDMLDDQTPYRRLAKAGLEKWFLRNEDPDDDSPVREGRRRHFIDLILTPLGDSLAADDLARVSNALGTVIGIESMISLIDGMLLDVPTAKQALLDAGRWMLAGALAELGTTPSEATEPVKKPRRKRG